METSEDIVEMLVATVCSKATEREKHLFREALYALIGLARTEQIVHARNDFQTALRAASANYNRPR
jgi:hypothetical protein